MPTVVSGQVGEQIVGKGVSTQPLRQGNLADTIVSKLNGSYYEQNYSGRVFSGGMGLTSINNATFTSATPGATATPIAGVWNPAGSQVNLEILQAILGVTMTALQATGGGPYVWMASANNTAPIAAITTGLAPFNRKTLQAAGSQAKNMAGVALTNLTNNLQILGAAGVGGGSASSAAFLATAVAMQTQMQSFVELVDGAIIVPPGGILALMATTTPVAHSAVSQLVWAEVPL
jgi:hypothetical protein